MKREMRSWLIVVWKNCHVHPWVGLLGNNTMALPHSLPARLCCLTLSALTLPLAKFFILLTYLPPPPTHTPHSLSPFGFHVTPLPPLMPFFVPQMSTKEKLIGHVMKEEPVGSKNKVTVVGVGMVGMASAISVLLKVSGVEKRVVKCWERAVWCSLSVDSAEIRRDEVYNRL